MSDYEILMIVFTVIGLLIALYNSFRKNNRPSELQNFKNGYSKLKS